MDNTGLDIVRALQLATMNPARQIGAVNKGTITVGKDADLVIIDDCLEVFMTIVRGNVFRRE